MNDNIVRNAYIYFERGGGSNNRGEGRGGRLIPLAPLLDNLAVLNCFSQQSRVFIYDWHFQYDLLPKTRTSYLCFFVGFFSDILISMCV